LLSLVFISELLLLSALQRFFRPACFSFCDTLVVFDEHTANASALWVAMTWSIDHIGIAPIALITAPKKRCGKTVFLETLGKLVRRSMPTSGISRSALGSGGELLPIESNSNR
jgi:hypothetical protein